MVKKIDEKESDLWPEHIGWLLWQAAGDWKLRFRAQMVDRGHHWHAEACAQVLPHVAPDGSRQSDIVAGIGLSKQAVQQLIVELEAHGIVARQPDPKDRRGRIVVLTAKGLAAQKDAANVKRALETEMRVRLGARDFEMLKRVLARLNKPPQPTDGSVESHNNR